MKTDIIEIINGDTTDTVNVRSFKYLERARLIQGLRDGVPAGSTDIPFLNGAEYQLKLIAQSVVDDNGKPVYTVDDVDDWDVPKITAYAKALDAYQNPTVEAVAKNSTATTGATS